nr:integrase, catalytic region, zinc finger, CCHC-type, peptidase aspartic, catalytic [Tanacetum cinerariifolium]
MHAKTIEKKTSLLTEIETLKAQIKGKTKCVTMLDHVKPKVLAPGMSKNATASSGSQPKSNTKKDRTLSAKSDKKKVEDHSRNNKSSVKQKNTVDSSISYKRTVINSNFNSVYKTCNKCLMSFNHDKCVVKSLKFVKKPHVHKVWRVKQVKQVWQETRKLFTNVRFQWQTTGRKFTLEEQCPLTRFTESKAVLVTQPKSVSTSDIVITKRLSNTSQKPLTRTPTEIRDPTYQTLHIHLFSNAGRTDRHLVFRLRHDEVLSYLLTVQGLKEQIMFVASSVKSLKLARKDLVRGLPRSFCYTQNQSLIHTHHNKTPYEPVHDKKPDLKFLCVFGALCYQTNDSEDLGKLRPTTDIGIFVGYAPNSKGYRIYNKRTRRIMETIHVQFDELSKLMAPVHISTGRVERSVPPALAVQVLVVSAGTPSSTTIDQDAPSISYSPSSSIVQPPISHQEPSSDESSSGDVSSAESTSCSPHNHIRKWSKDHPLDNVIRNPSRPVSTRKKLATDALWCLYNSVLSKVKPKNVKTAMDEACWFEAMQEEIYEFDQLQVWEFVPKPYCVMIIALKLSRHKEKSSGSAQFLGDKLVSWSSKKQKSTAISTTKAEYIAHVWMLCSDTLDEEVLGCLGLHLEWLNFTNTELKFSVLRRDNMANENVLAPAPIRSDDQILLFATWVPIGKRIFRDNSIDQAHQFVSPSSGDAIMDSMNELGYTEELHFVLRMAVNNLYQPWRAILSMINQCLTGKTSRKHNINQRFGFLFNMAEDDHRLGNLKFIPKGEKDEVFGMQIPKELITDNIKNASYYNAYLEMVAKHYRKIAAAEEGKKKSASKTDQSKKPVTAKQPKPIVAKGKVRKVRKGKSSLSLLTNVMKNLNQLLNLKWKMKNMISNERQIPVTEEASTGPFTHPEDDTSANMVGDTPSPTDAKTGAETDKINSEGDTKILNIGEEQGEDVADKERAHIKEDQAGTDPGQSYVALARPDPERMHDDFVATMYPQLHEIPLLSTPIIDLTPPKPISSIVQEPIFTSTTKTTTTTLPPPHLQQQSTTNHALASRVSAQEMVCDNFEKRYKLQGITVQGLSSRIFTLDLRDQPHKINQTINEAIKEAVQVALQAQHRERFRDLSEADIKEILCDHMFESGSYRSQHKHYALYEVLKASMERQNRDAFLVEKDKSRKRRQDDQDPPPPPSNKPDQSKKKKHDSDASDTEDTDAAHLPKIKPIPDWLKPVPEEERYETPELDWVIGKSKLRKAVLEGPAYKVVRAFHSNNISLKFQIEECHLLLTDQIDLVNPEGHQVIPDVSKPLPLGGPPGQLKAANYPDFGLEELVPSLWIESKREYDISAAYGISHWWFKRKEFYLTRHNAPSDHHGVRSHMRILSMVGLKTISRYGYTYLKEIVLRRVDYKEYMISESDFKNMHPNDFEELYLLHLQGKLNHLSGSDKVNMFNAVNILFIEHLDICSSQDESRRDYSWFNNADSVVVSGQMRGFEYGEQDRKATILYNYETFKATKGEQLLDTYLRYLQVINDLKKCGYKKDICELNYKFLNNLKPEWKQYGTLMRQTKNLMDINIDALYNILKQNQGDVNDALGYKKKVVMVTSDPLALVAEKIKVSKRKEKVEVQTESEGKRDMSKVKCYNCKKEGHFAKDYKKAKVKDYNYYKTKMLLAKKDSDEEVFLPEDQAWMESSSDSDQEINANMVFMAKMEKVLLDSDESSSFAEETIAEVAYSTSKSESESEYETLEYYDNSTNYGLFVNDNDDQEIFHDAIESASENFIENHIDSQKDYDKSEVDHNDSEEKDHLVDKLIRKFNHKIAKCQKRIVKEQNNEFNEQTKILNEKNADLLAQTEVLQDQLKIKHVVIDTHTECQAQYAKLEEERYEYMIRYSALCDNDKQHRKKIDGQEFLFDKMSRQLVEMNNNVLRLQEKILEKETKISELEGCTIHMIMPSKDNLYNGRKGISFENPSYFEKAKDLRPSIYDEKVIGLGYTPMFLTHSDEALEIKKFKKARENKIEFAYDYENLNASYVNEKINVLDDYFQEIINPDFEKIDSPFQQTSSLKPYVLTVILEKIIIDLEDEIVSLLEKEKENLETIESLKSKGFESSENVISKLENQSENDCKVVEKGCDQVENSKVIASGMFSYVSQSVLPISVSKMSCASKNVENKTKKDVKENHQNKMTNK